MPPSSSTALHNIRCLFNIGTNNMAKCWRCVPREGTVRPVHSGCRDEVIEREVHIKHVTKQAVYVGEPHMRNEQHTADHKTSDDLAISRRRVGNERVAASPRHHNHPRQLSFQFVDNDRRSHLPLALTTWPDDRWRQGEPRLHLT